MSRWSEHAEAERARLEDERKQAANAEVRREIVRRQKAEEYSDLLTELDTLLQDFVRTLQLNGQLEDFADPPKPDVSAITISTRPTLTDRLRRWMFGAPEFAEERHESLPRSVSIEVAELANEMQRTRNYLVHANGEWACGNHYSQRDAVNEVWVKRYDLYYGRDSAGFFVSIPNMPSSSQGLFEALYGELVRRKVPLPP